ncbi:MAG: hypothetical protein JWO71_3440 [Candidatus Acidoferrum typicum]|nr:hypothetical protein [Candidatus Acidoferrum typicum]
MDYASLSPEKLVAVCCGTGDPAAGRIRIGAKGRCGGIDGNECSGSGDRERYFKSPVGFDLGCGIREGRQVHLLEVKRSVLRDRD